MTSSHQRIMRELIILLSIPITVSAGAWAKEDLNQRKGPSQKFYMTSSVKHDT